ncbi:hypothetical protein [Streptomonospora nanhaiensis]|uniref:hypothetical protein n=1 Tax=Streptomonospora nanhaiensis TaxID=1323731 RepID=UPI001C388FAD|nr:hypothetical protein [Streptomonospora nanhaiensis]MBV2364278.1 hypothetical protein [Streptomonospora nanhaiensis]
MTSGNTNGTPCHLCGRPSGDDAYTCTTCADTLRAALREITGHGLPHGLDTDLDIALAKQGTRPPDGGRPNRACETPIPIDLRASEAAHILRNTLSTWVRLIHADGSARPLPDDTLPAMAAWLLPLCGWLRHTHYGPEAIDEITTAVAQARRAVDTPPSLTYVGPCQCGHPVYARPGAPVATCRECGTSWGVAEQRQWLRDAAEGMLMTAAQIARATSRESARVTASTVRSWASRGRLVAHGHDRDGRPLYRLGDALDLLAPMEAAS